MRKASKRRTVEPYSILAFLYDRVMLHVDYRNWATYIDALVKKYSNPVGNIVDISCGTGTCCYYLNHLGYSVTGFDASKEMLKQARRKAQKKKSPIYFGCAGMTALPLRMSANVVISLYDSINYLLYRTAWLACFKQVYHSLVPGGLFIFDVSTLYNSRTDFSNYIQNDKWDEGSYHRRSWFEESEGLQINEFEIRLADHPGILWVERHIQKIRSIAEIIHLIEHSNFTLVHAFKDFTFDSYSEGCERIHFVLEKQDGAYAGTS